MAEAERIKGELLLTASPNTGEQAEACFLRALACARRQKAKLWELHCAHSLATLLLRSGRHAEARDLLAPVCQAFPARSDLLVLVDAKSLLDTIR